jgi:TolB protein
MTGDGANQRRIVATTGFDGVPVPSPDGALIAFQRGKPTGPDSWHWELYTVDSTGGAERQLTRNAWSSQVPSWSPNGRRLAFFANPQGRDQLFVMEMATGAVRPLAPSDSTDDAPAFSPDGRYVAFVSTRDGPRDLYRVDVETGAVVRLTRGITAWAQPSWSPDGRRLLFSASSTGVNEIYWMYADGTPGLYRLTTGWEGIR